MVALFANLMNTDGAAYVRTLRSRTIHPKLRLLYNKKITVLFFQTTFSDTLWSKV